MRAPQATIIAIDCPSGLDCDTGKIDQNALIADQTITFIAAKHGQFLLPGANHVGELIIVPLDIPQHVETRHTIATGQTIQRLLKPRNPSAHKGTSGKALIIGGSSQYIGAVGLAAEAAYRIGAGLVTVATTNPVIQALSAQLLEPIWLQLPNHMGAISENASRIIRTEAAKANAVLLGPGIGRAKTTELTLKHLFDAPLSAALNRPSMGFGRNNIPHTDIDTPAQFPPLVIDADALYLLSQIDKWWKKLPTPHTILTPHPGEMAQLAGVSVAHIQRNRWKVAQSRAAAWGVTLVLKGANTLIATPEGDVTVIPFKTPALATAGTGDILAGMIVGLLAQGYNTQHAAIIAAYLHGLAGKERQVVYGTRGTIAQDILRNALLNALEKVESRDTIY